MARRRKSIPQYEIDGEAIYIPPDDSAWNMDAIIRERQEHKKAGSKHPYDAYRSTDTRGRLESVLKYLDMDAEPEQWHLEVDHFPPRIRRECDGLIFTSARKEADGDENASEMAKKGFMLCFKYGIRSVTNPPFAILRQGDGGIRDDTIADLDRLSPHLVEDIGAMIWYSIQPLSEAEAK